MSAEAIQDFNLVAHGVSKRQTNGTEQKKWNKPPTSIPIPRAGSSKTASLNRFGSTQWSLNLPYKRTVAPKKRFSPSDDDPRTSKRQKTSTVLSGPFNQKLGRSVRQSSLRTHTESGLEDTINGHSSPDAASDDELDCLQSPEKPLISAESVGTPSGQTKFPSINTQLRIYENSLMKGPINLPHMDMIKERKANRIKNMKDREGKMKSGNDQARDSSLKFVQINQQPKNDSSKSFGISISQSFVGRKQLNQSGGPRLTWQWDIGAPILEVRLNQGTFDISSSEIEQVSFDGLILSFIIRKDGKLSQTLSTNGLISTSEIHPVDHYWVFKLVKDDIALKALNVLLETEFYRFLKSPTSAKKWFETAQNESLLRVEQLLGAKASTAQRKAPQESETEPPDPRVPSPPSSPVKTRTLRGRHTHTPPKPIPQTRVNLDDDEITLIYPFTGVGSIQITKGEQRRLEPGEFLNDTIIEFALKYWLDSLHARDPQLADQIYVFSPFFYRKLKNKDMDVGYRAVQKWTSKVDIFRKRYLVVPINENLHWYLAIILYPERILDLPTVIDISPEVVDTPRRTRAVAKTQSPDPPIPIEDTIMNIIDEEVLQTQSESDDVEKNGAPGSILHPKTKVDEMERDSSPLTDFSDDEWRKEQERTWVLTFDSLGGGHPSVFKTLKQYLIREVKQKKSIDIGEKPDIREKKVPSPAQPNYCDCGVYLIQITEIFLKRPDEFFHRLMDPKNKLTENHALWELHKFSHKREALQQQIEILSVDWHNSKGMEQSQSTTGGSVTIVDKPADKDMSSDDDDLEIIAADLRSPSARKRQSKTYTVPLRLR